MRDVDGCRRRVVSPALYSIRVCVGTDGEPRPGKSFTGGGGVVALSTAVADFFSFSYPLAHSHHPSITDYPSHSDHPRLSPTTLMPVIRCIVVAWCRSLVLSANSIRHMSRV